MAMHIPAAPGFSSMMKEGSRYMKGLEESVIKNIEACVELATTTSSTYGLYGMKKMLVNHLGQKFVTKDAGTVLKELEIEHPAAKLMALAADQQEQECGECTNFVIMMVGALLERANWLLKMGLSIVDVVDGYEKACKEAMNHLSKLSVDEVNINDFDAVKRVISCAMNTKINDDGVIAGLVTKACLRAATEDGSINVDNVRVVKILGGGLSDSTLVNGMVFIREAQGTVQYAKDAKVAVYSCPFDQLQTETKGTVLINSADELKAFSHGEEQLMEDKVNQIKSTGCQVVVCGGKVGDLAMHYANKAGLLVIRLTSKFDVRRVCKITGAVPLPKLSVPTQEELGNIGEVRTEEFGRSTVVIFDQGDRKGNISTVVVRGAMMDVMNEVERAVDDGVNTYKCLSKDNRILAGAGATEVELGNVLREGASGQTSLNQYAVREYASALECIVKALCDNAGENSTDRLAELRAAHSEGHKTQGLVFGLSESGSTVKDAVEAGVVDTFVSRYWGLRFATDAANTILRVDQIIMARSAGGPKARAPGNQDPDDDEM